MADRSMKALLLDEAQGPSDRPLRLVRADDAGAPASSSAPGPRVSAPSGAPRGSASTHASPTPPKSPKPAVGTPAVVVPGLGAVPPSHVGASVGLVSGVAHHALAKPNGDPKLTQIAQAAQHDPTRWGADLLLRGHNPKRYLELARDGRLPSQVWAQHEGTGRLGEHLRAVHERYGEELGRLHGHRPMGERALLGLAAASHVHADVARALDALHVHHTYPSRASFAHLMHGLGQHEVARIASAFLVPGRELRHVLEEYRVIRERLERAHTERRRELLRRLRRLWAGRGPALVPIFAAVTHGYSPVQVERLRLELARGGDIEATFEAIEQANVEARLASAQAAFRRWMMEWEASHPADAQTPLQEPQTILLTTAAPPMPLIVVAPPAAPATPAAATEPDEPDEPDEPEAEPAEDAAPDSTRQLVLQGPADDAEKPDEEEAPEVLQPPEGSDAQAPRDHEEAGYVRVVRAPAPGAHAADGVLPWPHLMQGFRRRDEAELARAWNEGRPWDAYHAILARRAAETTAAREAAFCRRLAALGCELHGPCRLPREQLAALAHLGMHFAPEQWARLTAALMEGTASPLDVWQEIERENVAEAIAVREAAFLRHLSAWGAAPGRWNPGVWRRWAPHLRWAVLDGEASGLLDDLNGALGGSGAEAGRDVLGVLGAMARGGAGGDLGALGDTLGRFATSALSAAGSGEADLGGKLGRFAQEAVGALQGTTPVRGAARVPDVGRAVAAGGGEASGLLEDVSGAVGGGGAEGSNEVLGSLGAVFRGGPGSGGGADGDLGAPGSTLGDLAQKEAGALPSNPPVQGAAPFSDLGRAIAAWGDNPLGRTIVQALTGIGLPGVAVAQPSDLLRMIPRLFPRPDTDPSGWWRELTAGQGLDEVTQKVLRATLDADGPSGIQHTIAVYQRMLQGPSDRLRARREALFKRILEKAEQMAGPAFDPSRLPGGDPFVLLAQHVSTWWRVREAILKGEDPLGAFRRAEAERQNASLHEEAPARMAAMLEALWNARRAAGWGLGNEAGEPSDPGEAGAMGVHREPAHEGFRRGPVHEVFRREPWREGFRPEPWREGFRHDRPRPLYHLSFARPMSHRELGRILHVVPALQAHPEGVLREMAGLASQAIDVRGVDATTGEYLLIPGETFADIAYKLVGDRARWRELEAANPLRAEGDVRVRIPPGWFGYVPYAIPRRRVAGEVAAAVLGGPRIAVGEPSPGLFHHHHHHHHHHRGLGPVAGRVIAWRHEREAAGPEEISGAESEEAGLIRRGGPPHGGSGRMGRRRPRGGWRGDRGYWLGRSWVAFENAFEEDPEDTSEVRSYTVTHDDARGPLSPRYAREVAERIAGQSHGLHDGHEWLRPDWWGELREVNPQKPLASNGWWRDIHKGETLWIPGYWPMPMSEPPPEASEAGGLLDLLGGLNPFGSSAPRGQAPDEPPPPDEPDPPVDRDDPAELPHAPRRNTGPRPSLTKRIYVVKKGDWPQKIAKACGAATRPHWLSELQRANPHKPVDSSLGNWFTLNPGETINLPDAWGAGSAETGGYEAAGPDVAWPSLAEMQARAPYFSALVNYFRSTHDPEGFWRGYGNNLTPSFERVLPGEARGAILEISGAGFYIAAPGASGPVGWRRATADELRCFKPDLPGQLGGITLWVDPASGVDPGANTSGRETGAYDTGALTERENLTHQTYAVLRGEGMFDIAKKFGAASRSHWFAELRDANPTKTIATDPKTGKQVGWRSLNPGDIVNIPDVWAAADSPHARPAPGGSPSPAPYVGLQTFPPLPEHGAYPSPTAPPGTTPAAATVDPGTILRVQGILVAFRHAHPTEMTPANFGDGLPISPDCLGVMTPRTQQALSSFQKWINKQGRFPMDEKPGLRTDGVLDPATIAALDSFSAQALGGLAQRPPVLTIPGALPPTSGDTNPLSGIFGAATTVLSELARGVAGAADSRAGSPDPWADVFRGSSPPPGPEIPPRKPGVPAPLTELPDVLDRNGAPGVPSLPPGAPHGPRGPRRPRPEAPALNGQGESPALLPRHPRPEAPAPTATLKVPPEVYERFKKPGTVPPEETPPAKSRKADDGIILPVALAGLSLFSGVI